MSCLIYLSNSKESSVYSHFVVYVHEWSLEVRYWHLTVLVVRSCRWYWTIWQSWEYYRYSLWCSFLSLVSTLELKILLVSSNLWEGGHFLMTICVQVDLFQLKVWYNCPFPLDFGWILLRFTCHWPLSDSTSFLFYRKRQLHWEDHHSKYQTIIRWLSPYPSHQFL